MSKLQNMLMLTNGGYADLKKAAFACTLTNFAMILPFGALMQFIVELVKPLTGGEISWTNMLLLFGAGVVGSFLLYLCQRNDYEKTYVVSYTQCEQTRVTMAEHIRRLPMSVFNSKDLSELTVNLMGDVATSEHVMSHIIPQLIANIISISAICVMLAVYDWRMALAIFITVPLAVGIVMLARKIYGGISKKHAAAKLVASERVQEYIEGIKVIRACNMDGERFGALEKALREMMRLAMAMEVGTGVFVMGAQAVLQGGIGLTALVGATLLTGGSLGFVPLLMFLIIVVKIYSPVVVILTLLPELFYFQISLRRMRDLLSIDPMTGDEETKPKDFTIVCEHVDFSYGAGAEQAISDFSATIPAGSLTALVGPSGSGKSTISRLIARFWDTDRGRITIGGTDVKTLDPEYLMSYMSFVFQDVVLFNDTILGNIRIGNMNATDEQIRAAATAACCDEFADRLPEGYDTMLGENGATLSGGERQRISIARALLKDAPIVLLDEATASLDPENEAAIQKAISALIADKTVLVIAHRLRTIAGADKIIVLDKGRIAEQGSHEELMAKGGLYEKLYALQTESLGWSIGKQAV
ncbi:MAG: ABC transporter ATP-binding protein/permease [Clostridiales Family XIII bacterium]|jgi:ATP-binding cassette subfamily B protein|nr:ABC transporter ATP-binding protein/permease [Clostridiales Family XIII bacterium]